MPKEKTAIIIGAGIGGIATSVFLARQGYKVTIYEKNSGPGGRCGQINRDGHRFDIGATIYLMPEVYKEVFELMGISASDIKAVPLNTLYKIYFEDGTPIEFTTNKDILKEQLEAFEKGSFEKSQQVIKKGYDLFKLAKANLLAKNFYHFFEFITLKNALLLLKLKTHIRHTSYIKRFFRNKYLQIAFTFQNIYVGQSPYKAPALFSMVPSTELTEGSLFPVGGMYSITTYLVSVAEKLGVRFVYNEAAVKIQIEDKKAAGIILNNGSLIRANVVIANADLPYVYRELLPDKNLSRKIDNLKFSCSAIVLHWGLDKAYDQLSHHSVFLSGAYRENLNKIFNEYSISNNPSFYVHAPVRSDKSAAPEGHDTLSIIIPAGHLNKNYDHNWNKLKNDAKESVIKRLKKAGLTDIDQHIKFEICYIPQTWKSQFNLSHGSTFGSLGHNIFQMGYFRPHNQHRKYKNLYFTGGSTHPGNGIPLVLLSAKLTSERIIKEQ